MERTAEETLREIITTLEASIRDAAKTDKGNKAASVRVRGVALNTSKRLLALRGRILADRKARGLK